MPTLLITTWGHPPVPKAGISMNRADEYSAYKLEIRMNVVGFHSCHPLQHGDWMNDVRGGPPFC